MLLFTPGPCATSTAVKEAACREDLNHRDPQFKQLLARVKEQLETVDFRGHSYLLGGSGTAAVEAMICSCINRGPVLIIANGYYSDRIDLIFQIYGIEHKKLGFDWLGPVDLDHVQRELKAARYEAVFVVHNETTTGRLNPVGEIAELCEEAGSRLFVDAMSSFGADPLPAARIDGICSSANKCLHGLPGVSFVILSPDMPNRIESYPCRSYYLSLPIYYGTEPPLTPPVPILSAFDQALKEFHEGGGLSARHQLYQAKADLIRGALQREELLMPVKEAERSCTLTMAEIPRGYSKDEWLALNYQQGFLLYPCKGELSERYFQVANMGELTMNDIERWCQFLQRL